MVKILRQLYVQNRNALRRIYNFQRHLSIAKKMPSAYQEAIRRLENLQTNYQVLQSQIKSGGWTQQSKYAQSEKTLNDLDQGELVEKLQKIPLFHVAGTKGKGTTSAMIDSLLREKGFRTGLFTSPHLCKVNERIRIDGKPISDEDFAFSFHHIYEQLKPEQRPAYFSFLTLVAFHAFSRLRVDVVILEVGIGGTFCTTSLFPVGPMPRVCCVTALGYDHMSILGHTIEEISRAKAGIFRRNATLISTRQEYTEAHKTLLEEAKKIITPLLIPSENLRESLYGKEGPMKCNASVALTAVRTFFGKSLDEAATKEEMEGLNKTFWPGRQQIVWHNTGERKLKVLLDGAHTLESLRPCVNWAAKMKEGNLAVLMNVTKDRKVKPLIDIVADLEPSYLILSPNVAKTTEKSQIPDKNFPIEKQLEKINEIESTATKMGLKTLRFNSVNESLENLPTEITTVLITGSLYLVGAFFQLRPDLPL
ncbi:Oidioi.mRNA.OKI2018_I69.chr1.g1016.t1.cds [Oikopleura dioica]|uniref:tetrahydrofolate synthase n=1 Tax=Oikopleura dioica TaxID=34765 RepID=A0ABN7SLM4_OIKDI|nr:Oidioi.mRNA.OKI2018_I69.chr1.g1016.t1.cds [Oikopleura dioica]